MFAEQIIRYKPYQQEEAIIKVVDQVISIFDEYSNNVFILLDHYEKLVVLLVSIPLY